MQGWIDWKDFRATPHGGDMLDEPASVVQAIRIATNTHAEIEAKAKAEQQR